MERITPVMPVAPTPPGASERPVGGTAGGVPETPTSLLGPILLGAACGWIVMAVASLAMLVAIFSFVLATARWLPYIQPALLLTVTGTLAIRGVRRDRALRSRGVAVRVALALLIAWAPYFVLFVLPRSNLLLDSQRGLAGMATQSALRLAQLPSVPAAGWLTGIIAVFVWGDPRSQSSRTPNAQGRAVLTRWLTVALVASVAFALIVLLPTLIIVIEWVILVLPVDRTCGGACTSGFITAQLLAAVLLSLVLGILGGVLGGILRFGSAPLRSLSSHREAAPAEEGEAAAMSSSDSGGASAPAVLPYPRSLPGSRYWGSFLLGLLSCGCWLLAVFLSGIPSLSAPAWRAPAQIVLLLALPTGVVIYAGLRLRRDSHVLPAQAVYALLIVLAGLLVSLLEVLLITGSNAVNTLFLPFFVPVVLPLFGPALSLGVAIGFAWGMRRPDERAPTGQLGGTGAVLCGWVGFALPLIGLIVSLIVTLYTHSIVCSGLGGCMLAGAIMFALFEAAAIVALFGFPLMLAGLAIGRRLRLAALRQMALAAQ